MDKRDTIVDAACGVLASKGITSITMTLVAKAARVSTALVHYHFATKSKLLGAAAEALARRRTDGRVAALTRGQGLSGLDALWDVLAQRPPAERAAADLILLAREDPAVHASLQRERHREQASVAAILPGLFGGPGIPPRIPSEELAAAVCTFVDGAATALLAGASADEVRASYDVFWLALFALGQAAPHAR